MYRRIVFPPIWHHSWALNDTMGDAIAIDSSHMRVRPSRRDPEIFPPIKPAHAEALGYLVATWSLIEGALAGIAHRLLGIEGEPAYAVTASLSSAGLSNLIHAMLVCARVPEHLEECQPLSAEVRRLGPLRNDAALGEWQVVGQSHWELDIMPGERVKFNSNKLSTERPFGITENMKDFLAQRDAFAFACNVAPVAHLNLIPNGRTVDSWLHPVRHGGRRPATHDFPVGVDKVVGGTPAPAMTLKQRATGHGFGGSV